MIANALFFNEKNRGVQGALPRLILLTGLENFAGFKINIIFTF